MLKEEILQSIPFPTSKMTIQQSLHFFLNQEVLKYFDTQETSNHKNFLITLLIWILFLLYCKIITIYTLIEDDSFEICKPKYDREL